MKIICLALIATLLTTLSYAQNTFPTMGNVGIGTTNPTNGILQINGSTDLLSLNSDGGVVQFNAYNNSDFRIIQRNNSPLTLWTNTVERLRIDQFGNVGIGTVSPHAKFEVVGTGTSMFIDNNQLSANRNPLNGNVIDGTKGSAVILFSPNSTGGNLQFYTNPTPNGNVFERMRITEGGYVGIGTTNPWKKLQVNGAISATTADFNANGVGSSIILGQNTDIGNTYSLVQASVNGSNSGGPLSLNPNGGNVGINTTQPDNALTVNGTVHATQVLVDQTVKTPDYVFDKDYGLASLKDVKTYIDKNHHLPEIPSAAQVAKEGINLGEMNAKLLKKIEELTLYLIEKDKESSEQKKMNIAQSQINHNQEIAIEQLKKQVETLQKRHP